ncbi:hypothetical protein IMZ48_26985, partial [Candidatus Bathyarchaeota archaeon]|nr:hypothetical protein [Candidatus Bathyarchaeota archaeon]
MVDSGDTAPLEAGAAAPVSLSRYRSKRQQKTPPEPPADDTPTTPTVPSRYRHRSASLTRHHDSPPEQTETPPPVPSLPLGLLSTHIPLGTRSADTLTSPPSKPDFTTIERIDEDDAMRPRTRDSGKSFRGVDRRGAAPWVDAPTAFICSQP